MLFNKKNLLMVLLTILGIIIVSDIISSYFLMNQFENFGPEKLEMHWISMWFIEAGWIYLAMFKLCFFVLFSSLCIKAYYKKIYNIKIPILRLIGLCIAGYLIIFFGIGFILDYFLT